MHDEQIKKELEKELSKPPKTELEIQSSNYQQIEDQLDNLLFLVKKGKELTKEESELLKEWAKYCNMSSLYR